MDFCLPRVGVNGKRKLNFSLKLNCLTWSCSLLCAFHTTEPFLFSFILFSSEVWIPQLPRRTSPPPESNPGLGLIFGRHIFPREISQPPPWVLHLSDEQVNMDGLCLLAANQRGRALPLLPSGLAALPASLTSLLLHSFLVSLFLYPSIKKL